MSRERAHVAVVGAGPVGMVLALALHRAGIPVEVWESGTAEVRSEWRGSTLHPPTLQMLDRLGLAGPILRDGVRLDRVVFGDADPRREVSFPYALLSGLTPFPFRVQYEQYKLVRMLRDALTDAGLAIRYEHEVVDVQPSGDDVRLEARTPEGPVSARYAWVVGADGARSAVRKAVGSDFPGTTHPTQSLVVATSAPLDAMIRDLPLVSYWTGAHGRTSVIRTPDTWRIALSTDLPPDATPEFAVDRPHPVVGRSLAELAGGPVELSLSQHQFYRSHQRLVPRMRVGRVLLVGDAAHLSSTTGGMGLNSGIHDAVALAGALSGPAVERAVDHFATGRRAVASAAIQPLTARDRAESDRVDAVSRGARLDRLRHLRSDEQLARQFLVRASMLDVAGLDPPADATHPSPPRDRSAERKPAMTTTSDRYPSPRAATLDDKNYLDFTLAIRGFGLNELNRAAGAAITSATAGQHIADVQGLRLAVDHLPEVGLRNRVLVTQQGMTWTRLTETSQRKQEELDAMLAAADDAGPGSLTLDPDLEYPEYLAAVDFHLQPGGYEVEDHAGFVYHYGTNIFYVGRNDKDEAKNAAVQAVPVPADGRVNAVLDLACSIGQSTTAFKQRFPDARVVGVDIAAPMVRYAHWRARELGLDVEFRQEAAENLSFADGTFDLVYCNILFHELPLSVADQVIAEVARVLRPGGLFVIVDFASRNPTEPKDFRDYMRDIDTRYNGEPYASHFVYADFTGMLRKHFNEVDPDAIPDPTGIRHIRKCTK